jgi:hypothetical protein
VIAVIVLALMAAGGWLTYEPAPRIRILWDQDVPAAERAALEQKYALRNGRDRLPEGSIAYDLVDTSRSNIEALVGDPAVADTNDIDRDAHVIPPGTDRGDEWMWFAYRVPGLRETWARRTFMLLLAAIALIGLRRDGLRALRGAAPIRRRLRQMWNAHRRAPMESRDLFDRIPWRADGANTGSARTLVAKSATAALPLLAAGLPVLETWEALALSTALLAIVFGESRRGAWRLPAATAVVLAVVGLKTVLPSANIAEAHNAFLVRADGEALQQGLPPEVFNSWKIQFDALYPDPNEPPPEAAWHPSKPVPKTLYAASTDAIWRPAKYTRQVDSIGFRSLAEFRGGFTGTLEYNFWLGDLAREEMPFYVMYELTPATAGSRLRWTGQLFWERSDGSFEEVRHEQSGDRTISAEDAGRRVYAAFFPQNGAAFELQLVPSLTLRAARWADVLLTLLGGVFAIVVTIRPRWPDYLRALCLFAAAYYVTIALFLTPSAARLGQQYYPHGGGNDGLVYEDYGRTMAFLARRGHIVDALQGAEPVYWFTPGTRYVRMVEKLVFGDTNHLFALLLAVAPIALFYLTKRFVGALPAWAITGLFYVLPAGNLSFVHYIANARAGYGDGLGCVVFLVGLVLLLYHQPGAAGRNLANVWVGGAALAASMCIRPNFALAVLWLGAAYVCLAWRRKDLRAGLAAAAGLALTLWMPFHNWYYGGELYLISKSGSTVSLSMLPRDYVAAARDVLLGVDSKVVERVETQVSGWLWSPGFSFRPLSMTMDWALRGMRLIALIVTLWVFFRSAVTRMPGWTDLALVTGAAIGAQAPLLFSSTNYRHAMLSWDLPVIVLIVWLMRERTRTASEVAPFQLQPSLLQ